MASITVKTNISQVTGDIQAKLAKALNAEYLLRPVAFGVLDLITKRIHIDGIASDGGQIGRYSTNYLRYERKQNKRGPEPKVIISLTRQLENNYAVIATGPKGYGIGFLNPFNFDKSKWVEIIFKKKIFNLTTPEHDYAVQYINDLVNEALK